MNLAKQIVKRLLTACLPAERWLVRGQRARGITGPAISLTFDDGPHPEFTPLVLDRLQMFGWKATFFVIGAQAQQYPHLIRRMLSEGHEVGAHSWTHSEPARTTAGQLIDETRRTIQLLHDLGAQTVSLMRPPKGELTAQKIAGLWRNQQTIALWNVDPKDYRPDCEPELCRWAAGYSPKHGDIVLLHDAFPQALWLLDELQEHRRLVGVETVTVSTWLKPRSESQTRHSFQKQLSAKSEGIPCP